MKTEILPQILPQIDRVIHSLTLSSKDLNMRLISEIDNCLDYFSSFQLADATVSMIHVNRITFGKLKSNEYFFEKDVVYEPGLHAPYKERVLIKIGIDKIRIAKKRENLVTGKNIPVDQPKMFKQEVEQIIQSIHNITPSYAAYLEGEEGKDVK